MTKVDKSNWVQCTHDEMDQRIVAILAAAGWGGYFVRFSIYETIKDPVKDDLSDWIVKHPDFAATFARGQCRFILNEDDDGNPGLTLGYENPTWADVLVAAEQSCRARGAPELDHIFLEAVEPVGPRSKGVQMFEFIWGS
jgi:hypothetical protein